MLINRLGIRAAQQVPHVHFHIVPRPALNNTGPNARPSFAMFGRGQREELDEEEAEELVRVLRGELVREIRRVKDVEGVDLDLEGEGCQLGSGGSGGRKGGGLVKL